MQDLAASLPARLIPADASDVLDLCAAPGGKTMQLAAAGHSVTAVDRSESRLARLADNLARTGLKAELVAADALEWAPPRAVRRHPARRALLGDRHLPPPSGSALPRAAPIIAESAELQARLLDRAAAMLKPGGTPRLCGLLA